MDGIILLILFVGIVSYSYYRLTHRKTAVEYIDDHEPTNQEIRQSPEYRAWRIEVLKQNDFKCVKCPATDKLEAHHIYSFASFPELRFDTMNGIPLCNFHHKMTPNHGSKEKAFSQQLKSQ